MMLKKNLASWGMSEKYLSSDDGCSRSAARHRQMTNLQQESGARFVCCDHSRPRRSGAWQDVDSPSIPADMRVTMVYPSWNGEIHTHIYIYCMYIIYICIYIYIISCVCLCLFYIYCNMYPWRESKKIDQAAKAGPKGAANGLQTIWWIIYTYNIYIHIYLQY